MLHLNTHTPLTQRSRSGLTMSLSRHSVGLLSGNEFTRDSSGINRSQSSQLAEPLWTDPGLKSGFSVCKLISTLRKEKTVKKKVQAGNGLFNILPKFSHTKKKPLPLLRSSHHGLRMCVCVTLQAARFLRTILQNRGGMPAEYEMINSCTETHWLGDDSGSYRNTCKTLFWRIPTENLSIPVDSELPETTVTASAVSHHRDLATKRTRCTTLGYLTEFPPPPLKKQTVLSHWDLSH